MLVDLLEPFYDGTNSHINKYKVDCVEEKQTWLNTTNYSQSMGRGKIGNDYTLNKIVYPKPNSVGYVVMKFVCSYVK